MADQITFEVTLNTDELEFEIKVKDKPTWTHTTTWNCEVVPATFDLQLHKALNTIKKLQNTFDDSLHVTLTSIRNRKQCLLFSFGHDSLDDAVQMATKYVEVKKTILNSFQEIDPKVTDINLRCRVGEQHESSEQGNMNTDERSVNTESVLFTAPVENKKYEAETDWFCKLDEPVMNLTFISKAFSRLKKRMETSFVCTVQRIRQGSLIIECKHESREDGLAMMKNHIKVKDAILECLHEIDPHVNAIKVEVEYREESHVESVTATDTMTDVGEELFKTTEDLSEAEGRHRHKGGVSEPGQTSGSMTDLTRQLADLKQELKATTERLHRLETTHKKATPTPARTDPEADRHLLDASRYGDMAAVKRILTAGLADVNCIDGVGRTPVMIAARRGQRDVVELLVSEGADVSLVDKDGNNILRYACIGGDVETVKCVLSLHVVDINSRGERSRTPVMRAAFRGHRDVVELLVSEGTDVSLVDEVGNNTIHWACSGGDVETVKFVLSLHVVDINSRGEGSRTPVMWAAWRGHRDVVELLVSEGADVSLVDGRGDNILHYACIGGDVETVKYVLSLHVADINSRGQGSQTPVMWAAWRGHRDMVELLVSEGADVSLVDGRGDNILHYACMGGDVETVKYVLSQNVVDIDARNNAGQTAADLARLGGHQEVVKLL